MLKGIAEFQYIIFNWSFLQLPIFSKLITNECRLQSNCSWWSFIQLYDKKFEEATKSFDTTKITSFPRTEIPRKTFPKWFYLAKKIIPGKFEIKLFHCGFISTNLCFYSISKNVLENKWNVLDKFHLVEKLPKFRV